MFAQHEETLRLKRSAWDRNLDALAEEAQKQKERYQKEQQELEESVESLRKEAAERRDKVMEWWGCIEERLELGRGAHMSDPYPIRRCAYRFELSSRQQRSR